MTNKCHFCSGALKAIGPDEQACLNCGASYAGSGSVMKVVQFLGIPCPGCGLKPLGGELGKPLECEACGKHWHVLWDGTLQVT